ncbi:MAG: FKBP-type peptidylprolyl isomerase [Flavisolibacter sp.]|jgi:FKBP-type peptidyl-prolyl cis-trans isomerase|nr:FKBP-type peptidylprolyl isomerase [Flavisolibacter sp.]
MKKIFFGVLVVASLAGCIKGDDEQKCNYNECGVVAPASEIQAVQSYLSANSITAIQHCSGMFYTIEQQGTGTTPTACSYVVFNYKGKLTNGTGFDSTTTAPLSIELSRLVTGFKNGLPLLKTGGKMTLYIPPTLGYGSLQQGPIPANSIIIFNVELLGVQ